jgi:peptidyl-prolyl cis-trans isomerase A (cyclophilin A)
MSCLHRITRRHGRFGSIGAALCAALIAAVTGSDATAQPGPEIARICTQRGAIEIELDSRLAPLHTANFRRYVESGFYNGTVFHRVVRNALVQGGGYDVNLERRRPGDPVPNEFSAGMSNTRGTIAAARADDPGSATAQFFFNLADNEYLDGSDDAPGFTVFGRVSSGLEILDAIGGLPTSQSGALTDVPAPLIELESVTMRDPFAITGDEPDPASLRSALAQSRTGGDAAEILAAVDALRRACLPLNSDEHLLEAEAAIELGRMDRARYGLEQLMARANPADPAVPRAERLYAALPEVPGSQIEALLAHCTRPPAPSIPDGRNVDLTQMQAVETSVRRFRQQGDVYLRCVAAVIDGGTLNDAESIDAVERYNAMVLELTRVATEFNAQARVFKGL